MIALILVLSLQADPLIEKVERVAGDVNRPLLWTPLRITLSSASGYSGDVAARSEFGFSTAKEVRLAAGGRATLLLPAIDPKEVVAGKSVHKMSRDFVRPDHVVLVDAASPAAAELASTPQVLIQKISRDDLQALRPRGLLEVADLILTKETKEEAEQAIAALGEPPAALEAVDRALWPLSPRDGWVPTKRDWTLFFATVYAFSAFVALAVLARRYPKFGLVCIAAVALLGMAGYGLLFPRSQVWAVGERAEVRNPGGETREFRVWFVHAATELATSMAFPILVKPIFPTSGGTDEPFTIRVDDRGSRVEGLSLGPKRPACFGGTESGTSARADLDRAPLALHAAVLVRGGQGKYLGDVPAGTPIPATADGESPAHRSPGYDAWSRFVGKDGLYGRVGLETTVSKDLSPNLADERERPKSFILRLK
ncbi:MAG: hypothetical protein JO332_15930 [Planctomycetaceae bacterium]|nr:hypothetical protein [Planctomycetaceae bacterium]